MMYKKIYKSMCFLLIFTLVLVSAVLITATYTTLSNAVKKGDIIRLSEEFNILSMFQGAIIVVAIIAILIYLLAAVIADRITLNIIRTVESINPLSDSDFEDVFPELKPFVKRIASQNKEIKRQMEKVKSQKLRLQTIIENMNEPLVIVDSEEKIITANEAATRMYGKNLGELYRRNFYNLAHDSELTELIKLALKGENKEIIKKTGDKTYHVFLNPVAEKNAITAVVILWLNISEKAQAEKIRQEFSANVSHELKTPVTTIKGYAQLISNGIAKEDDITEFAKKIEKESGRLVTLIDDIIKLSKLDESFRDTEKEEVSLLDAANETASELAHKASEKNIEITVDGEESKVFANYRQVLEIIYNICDNAIKYNKENGRVKMLVAPQQIEISDTGIGIPEEYKTRIFERFFRVDKSHSKKVNGTGLGLSIVKHLAIANNAEITVESKLGEGTTFKIVFREQAQKMPVPECRKSRSTASENIKNVGTGVPDGLQLKHNEKPE